MLAVADAYEAMTADRPYRRALGDEAARAELQRCAGTQFDPYVVAAFIIALDSATPARGRRVAPGGDAPGARPRPPAGATLG